MKSSLDTSPARKAGGRPLIEVMESVTFDTGGGEEAQEEKKEERSSRDTGINTREGAHRAVSDLLSVPPPPDDEGISLLLPSSQVFYYGFNNAYRGVFTSMEADLSMILEIPDPENTSVQERPRLRDAMEDSKFNDSRYMGDYLDASEDVIYTESISFKPHWSCVSLPPRKNPLVEDITESMGLLRVATATLETVDDFGDFNAQEKVLVIPYY